MPNILVIDDTNEVRSLIVTTLKRFGFVTQEATGGAMGVQMALTELPDLIICDVRMPGMDGYHTLAAIRNEPSVASTPFIFLSSAMDKGDIRRGMAGGADDYVTKPFAPEELLEAVTTRLARQSELKTDYYRRAQKLGEEVQHLLSTEIAESVDGIMNVSAGMIREYSKLTPENVLLNARQINDTAARLNQLTKSLA